jgi:hypothetical protein
VWRRLVRQLLRFLGQFEFGGPWPQHSLQRCLAHHCSHVPKAGHDGAHKGDRLLKADADVEEHLGSRRRLGVCVQQNGSIGILNPRQSDRAATSVLLADSPVVEGVTGRYYEDCAEAPQVTERGTHTGGVAPYVLDRDNAERLWQVSNQLTQ